MTYYDPLLPVVWFGRFDLGALLVEANSLTAFNDVLRSDYTAANDPVAYVEDAFSNTDTTIQPDGLPLDVDRVCTWTWTCTTGDIHPNTQGYQVIARAYLNAIP